MRLTNEQVMQDNKIFAHHNVLTELKYCGWEIPHRKSISNADIRFYAWLCRSAADLLKEQEAKPMIENERGWNCPACGIELIKKTASGYPCNLTDLPINFCPRCGQEVKWE